MRGRPANKFVYLRQSTRFPNKQSHNVTYICLILLHTFGQKVCDRIIYYYARMYGIVIAKCCWMEHAIIGNVEIGYLIEIL